MSIRNIISSGISGAKSFFEKPLSRAFGTLSEIASGSSSEGREEYISESVVRLVLSVARADGDLPAKRAEELKNYLLIKLSAGLPLLNKVFAEAHNSSSYIAAAKPLSALPENRKLLIVSALIDIAYSDGEYSEHEMDIVRKTASLLDIKSPVVDELEKIYADDMKRRDSVIRSSAGLIAAFMIIAIFILTATFLKAVLFGLMMAYFFLPLEKWFENKFFESASVNAVSKTLGLVFKPITSLFSSIKKRMSRNLPASNTVSKDNTKTSRACAATVLLCLSGILLIITSLAGLSFSYVAGLGSSLKDWADQKVSMHENAIESGTEEAPDTKVGNKYFKTAISELESFRSRLEKVPLFKWAVTKIKEYLQSDKNREEIVMMVLNRSGGFFSYTAGFVGNIFFLIFNILLSFLFFTLFLQKIALAPGVSENAPAGSIVDAVMSSRWMPHTSLKTRCEAIEIIDNIILKLKAWVRGYFSIILIESVLYITAFIVIGVPYAPILGFLAGCTVLLPCVGAISSAVLTILVYFAAGSPSMLAIALVIIAYCLITGVLDQFFIYPKFVGGALGLTTLETIIVVLLGGFFAGIAGMIFAVPTASVLKYLIPKIYSRC